MGIVIPPSKPLFGMLSQETVTKVKGLLLQKEVQKLNSDVTLSKKEIRQGLDISPKEAKQIYKLMNMDGEKGISYLDIEKFETYQQALVERRNTQKSQWEQNAKKAMEDMQKEELQIIEQEEQRLQQELDQRNAELERQRMEK